MATYTTGEIAKLCGVTVRTVQYYDTRNILKPSTLSEGGRRLYSEEDVKRMQIICFLREAGISLSSIEELVSEEEPGKVISILLEQQEEILAKELEERQTKLELLTQMKKELKNIENFSVESISDIAYIMENKMMMKNTDEAIADVMTDGCDMGIKSLHRYMNKYKHADSDAKSIAKRLIASEEYLEGKLRNYL